jgi:adenine-specific DNA-methyltransferase
MPRITGDKEKAADTKGSRTTRRTRVRSKKSAVAKKQNDRPPRSEKTAAGKRSTSAASRSRPLGTYNTKERKPFRITRTELVWPGKYDHDGALIEPPRISLPFQTVEVIEHGRSAEMGLSNGQLSLFGFESETPEKRGWRNKLIWGDNLLVEASLLADFEGKIDLIYIDPPFATGADFSFKATIGDEDGGKSGSIDQKAYRDRWSSGVRSYCSMMAGRLRLMRDLLTPSGSIFIHLDWHYNHVVRMILDEVFGYDCFVNQIVVNRGRRKNLQGQFERISSLGAEHDLLLLYAKNPNVSYRHVQSRVRARKEQWQSLWRGNIERPTMQYELLGFKPTHGQFLWSKERAFRAVQNYQTFLEKGHIDLLTYWEETGRKLEFVAKLPGRAYPQYWLPPKQAGLLGDVWTDIQAYSYTQGYETEKHEDLLTRVIEMASDPTDLVADFFCGSGTTLAVAEKLGRRWIGCDIGRFAINATRKRLLDLTVKDADANKKRGCRPFELLTLGKHERVYWQDITFGRAPDVDTNAPFISYIGFVLDLYGAQPVNGEHVHGKKDDAFIRVSTVDATVTAEQIEAAATEVQRKGGMQLHVLGWDFEMGLQEFIRQLGVFGRRSDSAKR